MQKITNFIKQYPYYAVGAGLLIIGLLFYFLNGAKEEPEQATNTPREVKTIDVSSFAEGAAGVAYPTASGNSFVVRAEASGRVDRAVSSSTKVAAGDVIAQLDNDSQRAALTQAQGAYEAARASAAQSNISVTEAEAAFEAAKTDAIAADRAAMTAWNDVLYNTVDELFTNPRLDSPGIKIDAAGKASSLSDKREGLNVSLTTWQKDVESISNSNDADTITGALDRALFVVSDLTSMVETFIELLPRQKTDAVLTTSDITRLSGEFATARTTLNSQHSALEAAKTALVQAKENLNKARVGGQGGEVSAADAAITQALGSYQAAQAAYNKTLVRAPFAGTVSSLNVTVGDIINVGTDVAIIIPEEGAETTRWWSLPLSAVKYTPDNAYVFTVDGSGTVKSVEVETGLVTANSIRVTGLSGDEKAIEDVRGLKNGDQVAVKNN